MAQNEQLTDVSAYRMDATSPDEFDASTGYFERTRYDDQGNHYTVSGSYGYSRPTGLASPKTEHEPDTFYVEFIDVSPGLHLGSAALAELVDNAKTAGFHQGRMEIVHPRVVGAVEHLIRMGIIDAALYHIDSDVTPHAHPQTDTFATSVDLQTAAEARQQLDEWERLQDSGTVTIDDLGAVDCVFYF